MVVIVGLALARSKAFLLTLPLTGKFLGTVSEFEDSTGEHGGHCSTAV